MRRAQRHRIKRDAGWIDRSGVILTARRKERPTTSDNQAGRANRAQTIHRFHSREERIAACRITDNPQDRKGSKGPVVEWGTSEPGNGFQVARLAGREYHGRAPYTAGHQRQGPKTAGFLIAEFGFQILEWWSNPEPDLSNQKSDMKPQESASPFSAKAGLVSVSVRIADSRDYDAARAAYAAWGYSGGVLDDDVVYLAERESALAGIVRRTVEHGHTMLRGMWIAPALRRDGIGTALLRVFDRDLAGRECLCVPFTHLTGFYGQIGFVPMAEADAPAFLRERLASYRASGRDMLIMRKPPAV